MEFPLTKWIDHSTWATGVNNYQKEIAEANYPQIRLFTVERQIADTPQKDVKGNWQVCSPRTAADFSAVAYYFAREIYSITGFPVGLISSNWGGTPAESWTKKAVLETDADFLPILERYNQALADYSKIKDGYQQAFDQWRKEADQAKAGGQPVPSEPKKPVNPTNNKSPYQLYNAMIAPLEPFTLKGVLWYQGESNAGRAYQYRKLFPAMINNWRSDWGNPNMPFYFVQISPHRSQNPEIREAQLLTMLHVPYTGMVVTTDNGDSLNIHPRNKELVGKRLSLWALNKQYGKKDLVYSGPVYKSMKANDREIQLFFDYTDGGLLAKDGSLKEFTIAGSDHIFYPAKAEIKGNSVVVSNPAVKNPVAVRFAWKNVPEPNFYNKAGLPASPFRTDRWKGITEGKN
jgi:sialate O-acetylesterase